MKLTAKQFLEKVLPNLPRDFDVEHSKTSECKNSINDHIVHKYTISFEEAIPQTPHEIKVFGVNYNEFLKYKE